MTIYQDSEKEAGTGSKFKVDETGTKNVVVCSHEIPHHKKVSA
jgi:hypothetical protein